MHDVQQRAALQKQKACALVREYGQQELTLTRKGKLSAT
jgi:hypothetical protein